MTGVQTWGQAIVTSLTNLWESLVNFLPELVGALLVFLAGWVIATAIGKLATHFMQTLQVDRAAEKAGFTGKVKGSNFNFSLSAIFGGLVKWFLALVFLMASVNILHLDEVTAFLDSILLYLPNVVVAVIILAAVFLIGNFVYVIVKGSTRAAGVMSATLLAAISKWAIIIFGFFAALIQLGVASTLISTIFTGIVAMLALAGGLAFGLGGREEAALILKKMREELTEKR